MKVMKVMEVTDLMSLMSPLWAPRGHGASDYNLLTANR
jgi:hypothetical protein